MQRLVSQFTNQLTEALEIGQSANLKAAKSPISNISKFSYAYLILVTILSSVQKVKCN